MSNRAPHVRLDHVTAIYVSKLLENPDILKKLDNGLVEYIHPWSDEAVAKEITSSNGKKVKAQSVGNLRVELVGKLAPRIGGPASNTQVAALETRVRECEKAIITNFEQDNARMQALTNQNAELKHKLGEAIGLLDRIRLHLKSKGINL